MRRFALLAAVPLLLILCVESSAQTVDNRPITVVFRYDDYCGSKAAPLEGGSLDASMTQKMLYYGWKATPVEEKIINAFKTRKICCTFGVIPYCNNEPVSPEKMEILRKAVDDGAVEMAQHGYNHEALKKDLISRFGTEFRTIDPALQEEKIVKGKAFLEEGTGHKEILFVPPFNSYDAITLQLLEKHGFTQFSASLGGDVLEGCKLKMIPATCNVNEVEQGIESARKNSHGRPCMVVALMHAYDFIEYDKEKGCLRFEDMERRLDWVTAQKDVRVMSMAQACEALGDLDAARFIKNKAIFDLSFRVPPILMNRYPLQVYFQTDAVDAIISKWVAILWFFYSGVCSIAGLIALAFAAATFSRFAWVRWSVTLGATAGLAAAVARGLPNRFSSYHALIVTSVLIGVCSAVWLWWLKTRQRQAADKGTHKA